jgi:hypothetical protein
MCLLLTARVQSFFFFNLYKRKGCKFNFSTNVDAKDSYALLTIL